MLHQIVVAADQDRDTWIPAILLHLCMRRSRKGAHHSSVIYPAPFIPEASSAFASAVNTADRKALGRDPLLNKTGCVAGHLRRCRGQGEATQFHPKG